MHHAKNYANKIFPLRKMPPRTQRTARNHTGPIGVPCHQLAPRHEDRSSGSNDPIGDLEAQVIGFKQNSDAGLTYGSQMATESMN
jgi:hypothetical protein